jgi:hypothetical protein
MAKKRNENLEAAVEEAAPKAEQEELMDFEAWYALRESAIPGHHHKEILKADFNARKVPAMATAEEFDNALKKYGVKLA